MSFKCINSFTVHIRPMKRARSMLRISLFTHKETDAHGCKIISSRREGCYVSFIYKKTELREGKRLVQMQTVSWRLSWNSIHIRLEPVSLLSGGLTKFGMSWGPLPLYCVRLRWVWLNFNQFLQEETSVQMGTIKCTGTVKPKSRNRVVAGTKSQK